MVFITVLCLSIGFMAPYQHMVKVLNWHTIHTMCCYGTVLSPYTIPYQFPIDMVQPVQIGMVWYIKSRSAYMFYMQAFPLILKYGNNMILWYPQIHFSHLMCFNLRYNCVHHFIVVCFIAKQSFNCKLQAYLMKGEQSSQSFAWSTALLDGYKKLH